MGLGDLVLILNESKFFYLNVALTLPCASENVTVEGRDCGREAGRRPQTDGMRVRFSSVGLWEVWGVFFLFPALGFFYRWQHSVMKTKVS